MDFKGSVGYLIHELAQLLTSESDAALQKNLGIGFSQYKVMLVLEDRQGLTQKTIATALSQSEASISRQVGLLIDKDLVEIGEAADNREHPIFLTREGEACVRHANEILNMEISRAFRDLDEQQLIRLQMTLMKLRSNFSG